MIQAIQGPPRDGMGRSSPSRGPCSSAAGGWLLPASIALAVRQIASGTLEHQANDPAPATGATFTQCVDPLVLPVPPQRPDTAATPKKPTTGTTQ